MRYAGLIASPAIRNKLYRFEAPAHGLVDGHFSLQVTNRLPVV
jgi:hypothetical protein